MQRRLFKTDEVEIIRDEDLQGQCYVIHEYDTGTIDEWVKQDNHYYVNQQACSSKVNSIKAFKDWPKNEFRSCKKCCKEREELLEQQNILLERHGRLRGLELFSGKNCLSGTFHCHADFGSQELVVLGPALIYPAL